MLRSVRRSLAIGLTVVLLSANCTGTVFGQDSRQAPPSQESQDSLASSQGSQDSQNSGGAAVIETRTKSYVLEGLIFAALCGAALFAVCRSSPRGT